jgi:hypothetical protein
MSVVAQATAARQAAASASAAASAAQRRASEGSSGVAIHELLRHVDVLEQELATVRADKACLQARLDAATSALTCVCGGKHCTLCVGLPLQQAALAVQEGLWRARRRLSCCHGATAALPANLQQDLIRCVLLEGTMGPTLPEVLKRQAYTYAGVGIYTWVGDGCVCVGDLGCRAARRDCSVPSRIASRSPLCAHHGGNGAVYHSCFCACRTILQAHRPKSRQPHVLLPTPRHRAPPLRPCWRVKRPASS